MSLDDQDTYPDLGEHVCSLCGRHPRDEADFDMWAPLSGDGMCCGDDACGQALDKSLRAS